MPFQCTPDRFVQIVRSFEGEPNRTLSSKNELRFGRHGSLSIDLKKCCWFDHENSEGGDAFDFVKNRTGGSDHETFIWLEENGHKEKYNHRTNGDAAADIEHNPASDPFKGFKFKKPHKVESNSHFRVVKTWPYVDENNEELFQVCRKENGEIGADGKPVKAYCQRHQTAGDYVNSVKGIRQVPYRFVELIEAISQNKTVFIVEGEKCADAVVSIGGVATCNAMGAGKWPDELTQHFKGANVVILPDNDEPGAKHAELVATKLRETAKRIRIVELPGLPIKGDVVDWIEAGGTLIQLHELDSHEHNADGPLPLFPPLPDAEQYPIGALGHTLSRAAEAIANKVQLPPAMAAQSVLAVASLAASAYADVMLPYGQTRPLSLYFISVSSSGDRKSTADIEALWPVDRREAVLREENIDALRHWRIEHAAWSAEKRKIEGNSKLALSDRKALLAQLGDEPERPLEPNLLSDSPTVEGLAKNWPNMHAALGIFSAEGSMFTAGFSMNDDNRLKTAATLSSAWDGRPIKRIRAGDGISIIVGRRLAVHLMIQPNAAAAFLSDAALRDQGLLSRILVSHPCSIAGTRLYKETSAADTAAIKAYGARILSILETEPALAEGKRNELKPRAIPLSREATTAWIAFHDHVETQCGPSGGLAPIRDFAAKVAEHAARIAGVLTIVDDIAALEIGATAMNNAIVLADWYLNESCRMAHAGLIDPRLMRASMLLEWLQKQPDQMAGFREILRFGPNQTRTKVAAEEALAILKSHHWTTEASARPHIIKAAKA